MSPRGVPTRDEIAALSSSLDDLADLGLSSGGVLLIRAARTRRLELMNSLASAFDELSHMKAMEEMIVSKDREGRRAIEGPSAENGSV